MLFFSTLSVHFLSNVGDAETRFVKFVIQSGVVPTRPWCPALRARHSYCIYAIVVAVALGGHEVFGNAGCACCVDHVTSARV